MSPRAAGLVDNGMSMASTLGGTAVIRASQLASFPNFRLPTQTVLGRNNATLYRAVKPEELVDIQKTRIFRNLGSEEGKYFTTLIEGASSYAKQAVKGFGDPPYTLTKAQAPYNIFDGLSPALVDGGIPARVVPNERLQGLIPEILNCMPIPK